MTYKEAKKLKPGEGGGKKRVLWGTHREKN